MSFASVLQRLRTLENPYPGLRPFDTEEAPLFFGRDQQVAQLVARLERNRFVAVVGVSGSGKSSLVRAGLIPALERAQLAEAGRRWRMVVTRPADAPYERVAADLVRAGLDPSPLKASSHGLITVAHQLDSDESLLLVVDQFEEIFRYKEVGLKAQDAASRRSHDLSAADAAEFVQMLLASARHQPPVYIVLTMRSDYLGDCAEFRDLPEMLNDCQYLVPRMTREQRKHAIVGPLGRVEMEPALVQRLLNDAGDEPDQLPVLQHALMRTWGRWRLDDPDQKRRIELKDYDAIGGMVAALDRHADELIADTPITIASTLFKRLTAKGRSSRERRNPATLAELWAVCGAETSERQAQVTSVVDRFRRGEATFLVPRDGPLHDTTYIDITHESLIREWKLLRDRWLVDEEASAKTLLDLVDRARNWSKQRAELLAGLDLADASHWDEQRNPTVAWATYYAPEADLENVRRFMTASKKRARAFARRQRLSVVTAVGVVAVIAALALAGFYQFRSARIAREAAFEARILSVPAVRDPLTRALLLVTLGSHARPEHLAIYQEAASTPIPFAVFRYPESELATGAGFLNDGRAAVILSGGAVWSWRSDGHGDHIARSLGLPQAGSSVRASSITVSAFSPDGRWLAAGASDGSVWLERSDGDAPRTLATTHRNAPRRVSSLAFSGDARYLAVGYSDYTAEVFRLDSATGTVTPTPPVILAGGHESEISGIAVDGDGGRVVTGSLDGTIRVWNPAAPARPVSNLGESGETQAVRCVAISPDGKWLASGYAAGFIRVSRGDSHAAGEDPRILAHAGAVTSIAFSPDSSWIITGSDDYTARLLRLRSVGGSDALEPALQPVGTAVVLTHQAKVISVSFSADGSQVLTTAGDGALRLWPTEQSEPHVVGVHDGRVESVMYSSDGTQVLSASDDKTARLWSVERGSQPLVLEGHTDWVRTAAFSPLNSRTVVTASDDGTLRLWDLTSPGRGRLTQEASTVFHGEFSRSGDRFVTAVRDNTARVWKTTDLARGGSALETRESTDVVELHHDDWVLGAAFNRDGSRIATASRDGTVRIWDLQRSAENPVQQFAQAGATAVSAAFSPDASRVVAAFADGVARVWRVDAGSFPPMELRHTQDVNDAVFSSLGDWIATASKDGTARLWNARDGGERMVLQHGTESVRALGFDSTDTHLVTGTGDGLVRVWRITVPALSDYLSSATTACLEPLAYVRFLGKTEEMGLVEHQACEKRWGRTAAETLKRVSVVGRH